VIPIVDKIFSEYGIWDTLRADNGPPFNFADFAMSLGFKHGKITPLWPRANGEVDRFMQTIKSMIRTAPVECKCWKQEMFRFLRNYSATPHCCTGYPPATLLCGWTLKTKLPDIKEKQSPDLEVEAKGRWNNMPTQDGMRNRIILTVETLYFWRKTHPIWKLCLIIRLLLL